MQDNRDTRSLIVLGVCAAASIAFAFFAWHHWGPEVRKGEQYALRLENVTIPPPPDWVHQDIRAEAFQLGNLSGLSLLDDQLVEKVEAAFRVHTWVRQVTLVRKRPGGRVEIELEYRRPVALVELIDDQGRRVLQPVDEEGVVLPTQFLHDNPQLIGEFIRIDAGHGMPTGGLEGMPWGDARVAGAARIAGLLADQWKSLGLYRIDAIPGRSGTVSPQFELLTQGNSRILWGAAPGSEAEGEADASAKARYLVGLVANNGAIDKGGPTTLDIRRLRPLTVSVPR